MYVTTRSVPQVRDYEEADGNRPFSAWFDDLEPRAAARVSNVVAKLRQGLLPNVRPVGEGVHEARIDFGPGYRVYFGADGDSLILLLAGGDKRRQDRDIAIARERWADYRARKRDAKNAAEPRLPRNGR